MCYIDRLSRQTLSFIWIPADEFRDLEPAPLPFSSGHTGASGQEHAVGQRHQDHGGDYSQANHTVRLPSKLEPDACLNLVGIDRLPSA